jgi:hypothetical protein
MEKPTDSSKSKESPSGSSKVQEQKAVITYPKKPKRNIHNEKLNNPIKVICNLKSINFLQEIQNKAKVYQYSLHFVPAIEESNFPLKNKLIRQVRDDLKGALEKFIQIGDSLFVCGKNPTEKGFVKTTYDKVEYKIEYTKTLNYIDTRKINSITKDNLKTKNFVESIIKGILMSNNHIIRFDDRSFYDYHSCESFGRDKKAQIWHGYQTAMVITESGLYLRINDKNKMITGKTAYQKMQEISKKYGGNITCEGCIREFREYFKGRTVIAKYGNFRAYRIGDVTTDQTTKNTSFEMKDSNGNPKNVTILEYYKHQYNISLKYENQPLLVVEQRRKGDIDKERIQYLIPELVFLTGVDELPENDKAEIIAKSKFHPDQKFKKICDGMKYLQNKEKRQYTTHNKVIEKQSPYDISQEWGINFDNNFKEVEARTLSIPFIEFKNKKPEKPFIKNGRFRQLEALNPVEFNKKNTLILYFQGNDRIAKNACDMCLKAAPSLGMKFNYPEQYEIKSRNRNDLENELRGIDFNNGKKMVMIILDGRTKQLYSIFKKFLYTHAGITSQCMVQDMGKKRNLSYYSSVLAQMVAKSGGELFGIDFPKSISDRPSMIIGLDATRGKDGTKFYMSSTFNRKFNKCYHDCEIAKSIEEKSVALKNLLTRAINNFKERNVNKGNQLLPKTVIIYRSGGNEKQIDRLMKDEIPTIKEFFEGGYEKNYKANLAVFSVNKRTDLKFFERKGPKMSNIPMGCVIDQDVVSPDHYEFYLQCPEVTQGTASPVHFFNMYRNFDEINNDEFEEIAFKNSFYYWNWPGPIRTPVVLKYAEIQNMFSNKVGINMTEISEVLKSSPYFI